MVIGGREEEENEKFSLEEAVALAERLLAGGARISDAAKEAAAASGYKKGDIYKIRVERDGKDG